MRARTEAPPWAPISLLLLSSDDGELKYRAQHRAFLTSQARLQQVGQHTTPHAGEACQGGGGGLVKLIGTGEEGHQGHKPATKTMTRRALSPNSLLLLMSGDPVRGRQDRGEDRGELPPADDAGLHAAAHHGGDQPHLHQLPPLLQLYYHPRPHLPRVRLPAASVSVWGSDDDDDGDDDDDDGESDDPV
jgi:hypothetical protein